MNITINGTSKHLPTAKTLTDVVGLFCKQPKHVITEVNGTIVPCDKWTNTALKEGDTVELVSFVGGG